MATQREIRKRIKSVSSTKKITRTMEMISTSKMKKMQIRLNKLRPFGEKLHEVLRTLSDSMLPVDENIFFKEEKILTNKLVLMITGNRGLCSGYNTSIIENTLEFRNRLLEEENPHLLFYVIGEKGINHFKFINLPMLRSEVNPEDKITYNDAVNISTGLMDMFKNKEVGEIYISYTKVLSSVSYKPEIYRFLPLSSEEIFKDVERTGRREKYIIEPDPRTMLTSLLPMYLTCRIYTNFLESGYAEQNARRIAMKNATDAATDMVRDLTIKYNRARQAKITNEIAEIVGGSATLE